MERVKTWAPLVFGLAAAIATLLTIGPFASKEYAIALSKEAKASAKSDLDSHEQECAKERAEIREDLKEVRGDVKTILRMLSER